MVKLQSLIDANEVTYDYSQLLKHVKDDCPANNNTFGALNWKSYANIP